VHTTDGLTFELSPDAGICHRRWVYMRIMTSFQRSAYRIVQSTVCSPAVLGAETRRCLAAAATGKTQHLDNLVPALTSAGDMFWSRQTETCL